MLKFMIGDILEAGVDGCELVKGGIRVESLGELSLVARRSSTGLFILSPTATIYFP